MIDLYFSERIIDVSTGTWKVGWSRESFFVLCLDSFLLDRDRRVSS